MEQQSVTQIGSQRKPVFPCVETRKAKIGEVKGYDTIILGGGIYASGIAGLPFLKKHIDELKEKKIIVFCVEAHGIWT